MRYFSTGEQDSSGAVALHRPALSVQGPEAGGVEAGVLDTSTSEDPGPVPCRDFHPQAGWWVGKGAHEFLQPFAVGKHSPALPSLAPG